MNQTCEHCKHWVRDFTIGHINNEPVRCCGANKTCSELLNELLHGDYKLATMKDDTCEHWEAASDANIARK